ncbi:MAG: hypothetical protein U1E26_07940 [Coriobacteriia bacterium]|nr:hypothetical protein [Coriobacteriia bacterium]
MNRAFHIRTFLIALVVWLAFLIAGLPAYYQQYPAAGMVVFSAMLLPLIWLAAVRVLSAFEPSRRMTAALWLAFYFTGPLAVLDYLYCGVFLGEGIGFLTRYWYLTAFYILPWPILIGASSWLTRTRGLSPGT